MTPTEQAARWLADVPKTTTQGVPGASIEYDDALAAITRHLAPGDELVDRATDIAHKLRTVSPDWLTEDGADTITALLARISALTATVTDAREQRSDAEARMETSEREAATLRDRLARMEGALTKAANRLDWAAGIIESDKARNQVGEWADETRAALTDGGSNG